ncbi:phage tail protein [uncultured Tateyamaria sp.]|uniref:phage tail protein n=1 Tax=uncultured Tateyamaria sp. TaxID=455651 RepID=UPI0026072237|nr:tail fiber protein [uncultured Tateyamaria sp.]
MSEPFIGQIYLVGYNFAARGFALCQGQLLPISQNTALFSLLGTNFGGDGRTTFGLPNLSGRVAVGMGNGPGLTPRQIGQAGGAETTTMTVANMPAHSHTASLRAEITPADQSNATDNMLGSGQFYAAPSPVPDRTLSSDAIAVSNTGGGQAVDNMQPFLVLNYQIALVGIFPSRS